MDDSSVIFILDEMGHNLIHEAFTLMVMANSQAAQGIAKAAARGDSMVLFIVHDVKCNPHGDQGEFLPAAAKP